MKKYMRKIILFAGAVLILTACSNPVDIVEEVTKTVMEANSRYIEVVSVSPERNEANIHASSTIAIDFDRSIDETTFDGNIVVTYQGDAAGTNRIDDYWTIEYNDSVKRLTIEPGPWMSSSTTVTVKISGIKATDGSDLMEPLEWSFTTNDEVAFHVTIGSDADNPITYANKALQTSRGNNTVPVYLEFSRDHDLRYYLSTSTSETYNSLTLADPFAGWTKVSSGTVSTQYTFDTEGNIPLYLWVYDTAESKLFTVETKTVFDTIIVDRTAPTGSISLPTSTYDNSITATLAYSDAVSGVWKQALSNDGSSSSWTEYTSLSGSRFWYLRNNSGMREVHYRIYDNAGNYNETDYTDTINYYRPVYVSLAAITVDESNETGNEEWFWAFQVNNKDAFSRASSSAYSYDIPTGGGVIGYVSKLGTISVPAASRDANSAIPYTFTTYVDVYSSTGTLPIVGGVGEVDLVLQSTGTLNTNITTNVRGLGTSWPKLTDPVEFDVPDGVIGKGFLGGVHIWLKYWGGAAYASTGS